MPVRSLNSSVLKWPDKRDVDCAVRQWAPQAIQRHPEVMRIGYFGSYARGDWGVGSDLDMVVVVRSSDQPFHRRAVAWDTTDLPVPVDLLVYTAEEWQSFDLRRKFPQLLKEQTVWVYP